MRIACAQLAAHDLARRAGGARRGARGRGRGRARRAPTLCVLPEATYPAYVLGSAAAAREVIAAGPDPVAAFADAAARGAVRGRRRARARRPSAATRARERGRAHRRDRHACGRGPRSGSSGTSTASGSCPVARARSTRSDGRAPHRHARVRRRPPARDRPRSRRPRRPHHRQPDGVGHLDAAARRHQLAGRVPLAGPRAREPRRRGGGDEGRDRSRHRDLRGPVADRRRRRRAWSRSRRRPSPSCSSPTSSCPSDRAHAARRPAPTGGGRAGDPARAAARLRAGRGADPRRPARPASPATGSTSPSGRAASSATATPPSPSFADDELLDPRAGPRAPRCAGTEFVVWIARPGLDRRSSRRSPAPARSRTGCSCCCGGRRRRVARASIDPAGTVVGPRRRAPLRGAGLVPAGCGRHQGHGSRHRRLGRRSSDTL